MPRTARTLLLLLPLLSVSCTTAAGARRAELRRGLDRAHLSRSPAEIWPEVQRFLHERGYPLVGDDRVAVGQKGQGALGKLFSRGFETRVRVDGSRILETDADRSRYRVRAEAQAAPGGGSRLLITVLKESEMNPVEYSESRDEDLEIALLQRIDPAVAARVLGGPAQAPPGAEPVDPWGPVRHLLGSWTGAVPGSAPVRWRFAFDDGGKFLEVRGSPLLFAGPTARADAGEEMGRISRDAAGDGLSWHQFTAGGRVDRYRSEPSRPGAFVFVAESPDSLPAGARARLTLTREGDEEILAALELAEPAKDFVPAGEVRLGRGR